jgi:large subunit ribosomal protein L19e
MNLRKKKKLVGKVMGVGLNRIIFNESRLGEIKEAITRQDILDLIKDKAITLKENKGKRSKEKGGRRRGGSVRKKVKNRKRKYIIKVRKQRRYITNLKEQKKISNEKYNGLKKKIKQNTFKDIKHLMGETK